MFLCVGWNGDGCGGSEVRGICLQLRGGVRGLVQAVMAEGKEHALAIGYTKMSAKDMYGFSLQGFRV